MNTKDYIENKKSKKLSNILKGVLATGLVVGSMVTSTACKPNQPHESTSTTSSSTSTIETSTTTPIIVEDPNKVIKEKQQELKDLVTKITNKVIDIGDKRRNAQKIILLDRLSYDEDRYSFSVYALLERKYLEPVFNWYMSEETYDEMLDIFNVSDDNRERMECSSPIVRLSDVLEDDSGYLQNSTEFIDEIDDLDKLNALINAFEQKLSQLQQSDLVR